MSDPIKKLLDNMLWLADYLRTVPREEFDMSTWYSTNCKTTACIAGHACAILPGLEMDYESWTPRHEGGYEGAEALMEALGFSAVFDIIEDDAPERDPLADAENEVERLCFASGVRTPKQAAAKLDRITQRLAAVFDMEIFTLKRQRPTARKP
jgi:hypothetical protein